jgi:hypothetical protein
MITWTVRWCYCGTRLQLVANLRESSCLILSWFDWSHWTDKIDSTIVLSQIIVVGLDFVVYDLSGIAWVCMKQDISTFIQIIHPIWLLLYNPWSKFGFFIQKIYWIFIPFVVEIFLVLYGIKNNPGKDSSQDYSCPWRIDPKVTAPIPMGLS